jgi:hypothetical protein
VSLPFAFIPTHFRGISSVDYPYAPHCRPAGGTPLTATTEANQEKTGLGNYFIGN